MSVDRGKTPILKVAISSLLLSLLIVIIVVLIRWKIWKEGERMREVAENIIEKMKKRNSATRTLKSEEQSVRKADDIEDEEKWIHSLYDALW